MARCGWGTAAGWIALAAGWVALAAALPAGALAQEDPVARAGAPALQGAAARSDALSQETRGGAGVAPSPEWAERAGRISSLVDLAAMEYADAVAGGEVVNRAEYAEATEFLAGAAEGLAALEVEAGRRDPAIDAALDTLGAVLRERGGRERFAAVAGRVVADLASRWGAEPVRAPGRSPSAVSGARLYAAHCAECHGVAGAGDGPLAVDLEPPPADLVSDIRRSEATAARDFQIVTWGIPATSMPGWGESLTDDERWDLVAYVQGLRYGEEEIGRGRALALGAAEAAARRLAAWADPVETARRTDPALAAEIASAWAGPATAEGGPVAGRSGSAAGDEAAGRAPATPSLTPAEARDLVAFLRSSAGARETGGRSGDLSRRLDRVDSLVALAASLSAAEPEAASAAAVDAYLVFEGVERELAARRPATARAAELAFVEFRGALGTPRLAAARETLSGELNAAREALDSAGPSAAALAGQSFFLILREGFEAILIVGALIAFLVKTGHGDGRRAVHGGAVAAIGASLATAVLLEGVLRAAPARQEVLEGATMLVAAAVLFSVSYWLLSKLDHRKWEAYLRHRMTTALGAGSGVALAGVAFLAVYREGVETILFYRALLGFGEGAALPIGLGFAAGCLALAAIYVLFTRYGVRVPMRPFFGLTSGVLYYMAVVFAGSGVRELQEAGVVSITPVAGGPAVPLLGLYPTVETLAAQGLLLLLLGGALWATFAPRASVAIAEAEAASGAAAVAGDGPAGAAAVAGDGPAGAGGGVPVREAPPSSGRREAAGARR